MLTPGGARTLSGEYQACAEAVRRYLDAEPRESTINLLHDIRDRAHAVPATVTTAMRSVDLHEPGGGTCRRAVAGRAALQHAGRTI